MITYLINMTIALAGFLLLYYLLLQQETMYRFNRVYLLAAILCSMVIPLLPLKKNIIEVPTVESIPKKEVHVNIVQMMQIPDRISQSTTDYIINWTSIIFYAYIAVMIFFFIRYIYNLISILILAKRNEQVDAGTINYVLVDKDIIPFSFLRNVFVSQTQFRAGKIPEEIMVHEEAHVFNKHSRDIIFIELILCFLWFHPLLYVYRRAIRLNHEFEADSEVIQQTQNVWGYKKVLLSNLLHASHIPIASSFNFFITKKRIAMMTKQSSSTLMLFKKISTFPVVAAIVFFCSATVEKAVAQEPEKVTIVEVTMKDLGKPNNKEVLIKKDTSKPKVTEVIMKEIDPASSETGTHKKQVIGLENILNNSSDTTKEPGLTDEQMQEYKSIINSYNINLSHETFSKFSDALKSKDCIRLRALYNAMNMKQKMSQNLIFFNMGEVVKKIPEATTYESFKDSSKYQVYINGEKVPSSDLNKYKSSDFDNYTIFESNNPVNIGKSTVRLRTSKMGEKSGMAYVIFTGVNAVNIKFDKASFL